MNTFKLAQELQAMILVTLSTSTMIGQSFTGIIACTFTPNNNDQLIFITN